ncbi:MAG: hypothetical protein RL757_2704 [Bacteroidota bacterium]|jgi:thiol-disulfide isomerase/thioredoxin
MLCFSKMVLQIFQMMGNFTLQIFGWFRSNFAIVAAVSFLMLQGCVTIDNHFTKIAPGMWRGILRLEESKVTANPKGSPLEEKMNFKFDEATNGELPFQMEVKYTTPEVFEIELINGAERIKVESRDIIFKKGIGTDRDTLSILFPVYGSRIEGIVQERMIDGNYINAKGIATKLLMRQGDAFRFSTLSKKPDIDISGEWETTLGISDSIPEKAIGEFQQNGNHLSGTFRTETGDYRYLDGEIQANKMYLSTFDGSHLFLFEGKISKDSIYGIFRSGISYKTLWSAKRNKNFKLRAADSLTFLKPGFATLDFNFKNTEGKNIAPNNPEYAGKVRIITIMGTWCPNCRDETNFLVEYLHKNKDMNLGVIGLAFERSPEAAAKQLPIYKERLKVPYEIAVAATTTQKDQAAKALPALNAIIGYPTMIVMDKKGKVRKIFTGFDGPATSKYKTFQQEFDDLMRKLNSES